MTIVLALVALITGFLSIFGVGVARSANDTATALIGGGAGVAFGITAIICASAALERMGWL
jgi:hypothetical protein